MIILLPVIFQTASIILIVNFMCKYNEIELNKRLNESIVIIWVFVSMPR